MFYINTVQNITWVFIIIIYFLSYYTFSPFHHYVTFDVVLFSSSEGVVSPHGTSAGYTGARLPIYMCIILYRRCIVCASQMANAPRACMCAMLLQTSRAQGQPFAIRGHPRKNILHTHRLIM